MHNKFTAYPYSGTLLSKLLEKFNYNMAEPAAFSQQIDIREPNTLPCSHCGHWTCRSNAPTQLIPLSSGAWQCGAAGSALAHEPSPPSLQHWGPGHIQWHQADFSAVTDSAWREAAAWTCPSQRRCGPLGFAPARWHRTAPSVPPPCSPGGRSPASHTAQHHPSQQTDANGYTAWWNTNNVAIPTYCNYTDGVTLQAIGSKRALPTGKEFRVSFVHLLINLSVYSYVMNNNRGSVRSAQSTAIKSRPRDFSFSVLLLRHNLRQGI